MSDFRTSAIATLAGAAAFGALIGFGSAATSPQGRANITTATTQVAVATGVKRLREPQAGDSWGGCNDARAAGTAPIYRGEPGYSTQMDGDLDGIACEPQRN